MRDREKGRVRKKLREREKEGGIERDRREKWERARKKKC